MITGERKEDAKYISPRSNEQQGTLVVGNDQRFDFKRAKGLIMMMISALMTTAMNILIKIQASKTEVNVIQAIILRNVFLAVGCWIHMIKDKVQLINLPQNIFSLLIVRGIFGFGSTMGLYLAIDYLPLSLAVTIYYI